MPFSYAKYNHFSSKKSGRGHFYHTLEKNWYSYLEQKQAWCSSPWITKGSQRILSQLMPLPGQGAADTEYLLKSPDPGAAGDSGVSRWSQRLSLGVAFCASLINTVLTEITALASPLWQTPLLSLQAVFWPNTAPKTLFQTFLLFSWKSVQEGSCIDSVCLKKPVVLLKSPETELFILFCQKCKCNTRLPKQTASSL